MSDKLIKDPVHGYVTIEEYLIPIIDTAAFQRLKRLEQTSYRVLYPGSVHDRFIHSLGVYHIGRQVYDAIEKNLSLSLKSDFCDFIKELRKPFLVACLLHDIGHAPFSHTLEVFYPRSKTMEKLKGSINSLFGAKISEDFERDANLPGNNNPNQHELMSALICVSNKALLFDDTGKEVGISSLFPEDKRNEYLDFIIRAITGITYHTPQGGPKEYEIKNSLIRILNAKLIDVDKLDYIVRDSATSGYRNVEMDLPRLVSAFALDKNKHQGDAIWPVYNKSALSIIEHVIIARNNQIKWIQSHNAVVYETWLLQCAVKRILKERLELGNNFMDFFCYEALSTSDGNRIGTRTWRYLSDDDIISLLKENFDLPEVKEYFDRRSRKKSVWKTHSDYIATFNGDSNADNLESVFKFFAPFMQKSNDFDDGIATFDRAKIASIVNTENDDAKQKYIKFFKEINRPLDGNDFELLLLEYSAENWTKQFDPKLVYIKYDTGIVSYADVTHASDVNDNPQIPKGFFIYFNGERISPVFFKNQYNSYVNLGSGANYNF